MKIKRYFSKLTFTPINYYRVIHSVKTAFACLVGLALEKYFEWPMGQWVPITIMVVMSAQTHFGGALSKALMRFLGTVGGIAIVVTVLWVFGDNIVVVCCTIFFAIIIFTYIASGYGDISYAGTLGGVTVILVLTGQHIGIETAIQRGFYILIGIAIALLVSRFIFPIHARDRFRYHVTLTLRNLSRLYAANVQLDESLKKAVDSTANSALSFQIADDIANQPRLIHEAVIGSRAFAANKASFTEILHGEHSLNRLINLMYLSLYEADSTIIVKKQLAAVEELHTIIVNGLNYLADCLESLQKPQVVVNLSEVLGRITKVVEDLPEKTNAHQLIMEHSFLFFMEQIVKELENMRKLIAKVNSNNKDNVV